MDLGKRWNICSVAVTLLLVPQMAFAEEWWKDSFAAEGSSPCDNNDSIVTFTDKAVEMWEVGCTLNKVQKIKRLDAVLLDMTCTDGESTRDGSCCSNWTTKSCAILRMRCCNDARN